ncbi:MAG: AAA family ATPase, partial [Gemmatimonadales bacterium]
MADNIVAFVPGKSGSGASTVALHAAAELARHWRQRVLLVESDAQSGALATWLAIEADPEHCVIKALEES